MAANIFLVRVRLEVLLITLLCRRQPFFMILNKICMRDCSFLGYVFFIITWDVGRGNVFLIFTFNMIGSKMNFIIKIGVIVCIIINWFFG